MKHMSVPEQIVYPFHDQTVTVTHCGRLCFKGRKVNVSQVFAGQNVGVTQMGDRIWLVTRDGPQQSIFR